MTSTSTWFALKNPVFRRLWLASALSGTFVSAQDIAATWLMHDLGASSFLLSLMATAASAPFFLFTLPAGAVADIANRRTVIVTAVLWQAACSALLAVGAWTGATNPSLVLLCIFLLGVGVAFYAPVWGAIVPDIASKDELASAITLGGVQLNLSGIVGPALAGLPVAVAGSSATDFRQCSNVFDRRCCCLAVEAASRTSCSSFAKASSNRLSLHCAMLVIRTA